MQEIFYEYGYEYFYRLISRSPSIISCTIIDKMGNLFNCKYDFKTSIYIHFYHFIIFHNLVNLSRFEKINGNSLRNIVIEISIEKCSSKTLTMLENNQEKIKISFSRPREIDVKFQKISLKNTSTNTSCIQTYERNNCKREYIKKYLMNEMKISCIPREQYRFDVDDMIFYNNTFCKHNNKNNVSQLIQYVGKLISENCGNICENEFVSVDFDKRSHRINVKINLIPKSNFKPYFTDSLSMDFNNFIYDIGGTIGIWIGFSAMTFPIYIFKILNNLNFQNISNYIKNFIVFTSKYLISISEILLSIIYYCINFIKYEFNSIKIIFRSLFNKTRQLYLLFLDLFIQIF